MKPIITAQKARKQYRCSKCGAVIKAGQFYRRISTPTDGRLVTTTECLVCRRELPLGAFRVRHVGTEFMRPDPMSTYDLDCVKIRRMMIKMYAMGELAWDYADTVLDIVCQMKLSATKQLVRSVRELRDRYNRFASLKLTAFQTKELASTAEKFEEANTECFRKLSRRLDDEIADYSLTPEFTMLVKAVQMAMTIIDAMRIYDERCSKWLTKQGLSTFSILATHFTGLSSLLPQFAGDAYSQTSDARKHAAEILCDGLTEI